MSMLTPTEDGNPKRAASEGDLLEASPNTKRLRQADAHSVVEARRLEKQQRDLERQKEKEKREAEKLAEKLKKEAERKAEKERKEAERRAEKERKEAERRAEKERKEAEKAAEKERKEAEKQAEKERKEAEKLAEKERKSKDLLKAQPKINLFFKKSSQPVAPSSQQQQHDSLQPVLNSSADSTQQEAAITDYQRHILPFHVKANGKLFSSVCNYIPSSSEEFADDPKIWLQSLNTNSRLRTKSRDEAKLTSHQFRTQLLLAQESAQVAELLKRLRVRRLQFSHLSARYAEDPTVPINEEFRPPYVGSTKDIDHVKQLELAVDPFRTDLDETVAYDYDSEVEWDHEDGEDLRDEDGDDSDEDIEDQDELREFLSSDDDDPTAPKRSKVVGPLTPVVIWSDSADSAELRQFAINILQPLMNNENKQETKLDQKAQGSISGAGSIVTVEAVLNPLVNKVGFEPLKASMVTYNGNTGTKTLIVELLKQQFPEATSSEVRAVFDKCMERVGKKRTEKKWVLTTDAIKYFGLPDPDNSGDKVTQAPQKDIFTGSVESSSTPAA